MQADQTFPVKFTQTQRRVIADLLPFLVDRLKLDEKNPRTTPFTLNEIEEIHHQAKTAVDKAPDGMTRNSLRHVTDIMATALNRFQGIGTIPITERLYQFQITLRGVEPPIWRRIQVKECTLDKLHEHIQTAMGWTNSHLHQFEIDGEQYGDPYLLDNGFEGFDGEDSTVTRLREIVPKDGRRFRFEYEYDFGDCWQHEVLFEGCLRSVKGNRYPICVEGERKCPPEDVGGVRGYAEFLEVIADPDDEDHERFLQWSGPFDPDAFDAERVTKRMRRGLPDWRQYQ